MSKSVDNYTNILYNKKARILSGISMDCGIYSQA